MSRAAAPDRVHDCRAAAGESEGPATTIEELRKKIDPRIDAGGGGKTILSSAKAPAGLGHIRALCDGLEQQQREIDQLKRQAKNDNERRYDR
jgi:hypothetical protein